MREMGASRANLPTVAERIVVTDGTDSFYGSRSIFQVLHNVGDFSKITAFSTSIVDAKKKVSMLNIKRKSLSHMVV